MTNRIVEQGRKRQTLLNAAVRLNRTAFAGQTYAVETIDASLFAIVLHDRDAMTTLPAITSLSL